MQTCLRCLRCPTKLDVWSRQPSLFHSYRSFRPTFILVLDQSRNYSQDHPSKSKDQSNTVEPDTTDEPADGTGAESRGVSNPFENLEATKQRTHASEVHKPDDVLQSANNDNGPRILTAKEIWEPWLPSARPYTLTDSASIANMSGSYSKRLIRRVRLGLSSELPNARPCRPLLLTFDAYDTLFQPREPVAQQYCDVASTFGIQISVSDVEANFKKAFKELYKTHPNYGKAQGMHYRAWWRTLIRMTLQDLIPESEHKKLRSISSRLLDRFSNQEGYTLFQDVQALLALIGTTWNADIWAPRRTMLGVISNSDPRVQDILLSYHISIQPSLFPPRYSTGRARKNPTFGPATPAFATFSYNCGYSKPDPMIFDAAVRDAQHALDRLHVSDKLTRTGTAWLDDIRQEFHHMHVGDDLDKDVLPALECGWDAIWLDRTAEDDISVREIKGHNVTIINNLTALAQLVCRERLEYPDGTPKQEPVWIDESREIIRLSTAPDASIQLERRNNRIKRTTKPVTKPRRGRVPGWLRGQYNGHRRDWYLRTAFGRVFSKEEEEEARRQSEENEDHV